MKLRNKKTGEIGELRLANTEIYVDTNRNMTYCYKTIAGFNAEWKEYRPVEPLIKDERIRKAVRAWAEACDIKTVEITHSRPHILRIMDAIDDDEICFNREIGQVFDEIIYNNIAELCGEEE